ncbi:MAG: acyl-CoA synthetase, partial [Gemmatimonadota bacterium]
RPDLEEARVALLFPPGFEYVVTLWAIWRAGGIAVPLSPLHAAPEHEHILDDTGAEMVVMSTDFEERIRPLAEPRGARVRSVPPRGYRVEAILPLLSDEEVANARPAPADEASLPALGPGRRALILYTSGTTARPKGVVSTHGQLDAQVRTLVEAWAWSAGDRIRHVLPLHHTHGIVNALGCALYAGAAVEFAGGFDAGAVWERIASREITVFMAVPTIYAKLLRAWEQADEFTRARWSNGARRLRLTVSGSAALPVAVFERWEEITGERLLERYGTTEIGMALSNPYGGERRGGTVGQPLPGVELRLVDPESGRVLAEGTRSLAPGASGEIRIRGPMVFSEYWNRPEETDAAFEDGWFKTGDEAVLERGYYRILGRRSVDILKSGGYKISAIEIEEILRAHPGVRDCAVVGLPDEEWGERIAAAVVTEPGAWFVPDLVPAGLEGALERARLAAAVLDPWLRDRLAGYKVPREWVCLDELPRNAMGKVRKAAVREMFEHRE